MNEESHTPPKHSPEAAVPPRPKRGPVLSAAQRQRFAEAFNHGAAAYQQVRPGYPEDAVTALLAPLKGHTQAEVAELGAGTGQLTRSLLHPGPDQPRCIVHAIEPSAAMAQQLEHSLGCEDTAETRLRISQRRAEDTGLADSSCAAVFAAQSWHWFDAEAASAEAARISTDTGYLGLIWNQLDVRVDWVHRLSRIMHAGDVHPPQWRPPVSARYYQSGTLTHFSFTQTLSVAEIITLASTRTYWLKSPQRTRDKVAANIRYFFTSELGHPEGQAVQLPYRCTVYLARQRG